MTWQERLLIEQDELQNRIDNLQAFVLGSQFPLISDEDQVDIVTQLVYMRRYFAVLVGRTARHCSELP